MKKLIYFFAFAALLFSCDESKAQYTITGWSVISATSTPGSDSCDVVIVRIDVSSDWPGLSTKTFYDGGQSISDGIDTLASLAFSKFYVTLPRGPGIYTFKSVLFLGAMPIDSIVFGVMKEDCNFLSGHGSYPGYGSYLDINGNCVHDVTDEPIYGSAIVEVSIGTTPIDTIFWYNNFSYHHNGIAGTIYKFRLLQPPAGAALSCPVSGIIYDTVGSTTEKSFAFACVSASSSFDLSGIIAVRCGIHTAAANIVVRNSTCYSVATDISVNMSPKYNYDWSSTAPAMAVANFVTWHFAGVTFSSQGYIRASFEKPAGAPGYVYGDTVNSRYEVGPMTGDSNPANNIIVRVDTVKAGFDPNDISVYPQGYIAAGTELEYIVRFENTGNDTAFNIYVMDTVSPNVDFKTLSLVAASHNVSVVKYTEGPSNIIKFDFPNINLPDSSHHDLCNGMVVFKVKTKTGLAPGSQIKNRAGIYFDYNPVVLTNTVINTIPTIGNTSQIENESPIAVYPNPARDILNIGTGAIRYNTATITNTIGQVVASQVLNATSEQFDVKHLSPGIYFLYLKGESGAQVQRFEKM